MTVWPYALLGLPLTMAALPIYVLAPDYFGRELGLPIAWVGAVLFASRLFDAALDPWLGGRMERLREQGRHKQGLLAGATVLALAFCALWQPPPALAPAGMLAWLAGCLFLTCVAHSAVYLAYLSWGSRLSALPAVQLKASAAREAAGLLGVLLASLLPTWLWRQLGPMAGMEVFGMLFVLGLALGLAALLGRAAPWLATPTGQALGWRNFWQSAAIRPLLLPYFFNALAVAIPSTLALFYINDHLQVPRLAGAMLGIYFLGAVLGLPAWQRLAGRLGPLQAWRLGMLLAVACFVSTVFLRAGDVWPYAAVCLFAGMALGADLCLPPVLVAQRTPATLPLTAVYGVFQTLGKLALATSGLALPLLALFGYQPGQQNQTGGWALLLSYALLPCLCKLAAWALSAPLAADDTSSPKEVAA